VQEKIEAARKGLETNTDVFGLLRACFHTAQRVVTPIVGTLVGLNRSDKKKNALAPDEVAAQAMIITAAGQDTTVTESNEQRSELIR
jgi:cytochrome P450